MIFFKNMEGKFLKMQPGKDHKPAELAATFTMHEDTEEQGDQAIIAKIIDLLNQQAKEVCVICRTNDDVNRLAQKLNTYQVPYHIFLSDKTPHKYI